MTSSVSPRPKAARQRMQQRVQLPTAAAARRQAAARCSPQATSNREEKIAKSSGEEKLVPGGREAGCVRKNASRCVFWAADDHSGRSFEFSSLTTLFCRCIL